MLTHPIKNDYEFMTSLIEQVHLTNLDFPEQGFDQVRSGFWNETEENDEDPKIAERAKLAKVLRSKNKTDDGAGVPIKGGWNTESSRFDFWPDVYTTLEKEKV